MAPRTEAVRSGDVVFATRMPHAAFPARENGVLAQDVLSHVPVPATWAPRSHAPILDPLERTSEILFGVIMVLTFTSSISVVEGGAAETREVLIAAIGCNVAWGIVDAAFYLMAAFVDHARKRMMLRTVLESGDQETANGVLLAALPSPVAAVVTPVEAESMRQRMRQHPPVIPKAPVEHRDVLGAIGVFLLVFLSTLPIVIPFVVIHEPGIAIRASNGVAIAMLFGIGWTLGKHSGRSSWHTGLIMVATGLALVAITIALGG